MNAICVSVTKTQTVDEDIASEILNSFVDWLDQHGLLREGKDGLEFEFNSELVTKFLEEYA